jgi:glucose/arabinose dehydrogenase
MRLLRRLLPLAVALVLTACGAQRGSGTPTPAATSARPSPLDSASASAPTAPTSSGESPSFDPERVRVMVEPVVDIPGNPLAVVSPDDGSARLFVVDKTGRIWIVKDGKRAERPFLDISAKVSTGAEQGLLGLAMHPGLKADPRFYLDYTDRNGDTVVSEWRVSGTDANAADAGSEHVLLTVDQPFANHNGGDVVFGPDGYLYITLGDGGSAGDPNGNGQRLDTVLAKILRIDVDKPSGDRPYGIPADNPFAGRSDVRPEIYVYGMRNPWRISFDSATRDLWIGDVGQNRFEEIDVVRAGSGAGQNFGWNRMEGFHCYPSGNDCSTSGLTMPVSEYGHDLGCSVTGGVVARGNVAALEGGYLFSDYCSGTMWAIDAARNDSRTPTIVGETGASISGFGVGPDATIYATDLGGRLLVVKGAAR